MAQAMTAIANKPAWVDLASKDAAASRDFYSQLFGWHVEVDPDPQYGGYGWPRSTARTSPGSARRWTPDAPTAWSLYIGTPMTSRTWRSR